MLGDCRLSMDQVSLEGAIDLHLHSAPDVRPRRLDDLTLACQAAAAGMRAVLLKSHHALTADRAAIVDGLVDGVRVFGGLALNDAVGGLNPAAVEAALTLGAREIWMPTLSAANHLRAGGTPYAGINVLDEVGALKPVVFEILELIARADVILGTGHLSVREIQRLVPAARAAGVKRIVITHPELSVVNMPITMQLDLAGFDVFFERCLIATVFPGTMLPLSAIAAAVQEVGPETTVMATDFGQPENLAPVDGLREYIAGMMEMGVSQTAIDRMTRINPAWLLGL